MKTLGIIGGMGPLATAYFMELVVRMTDARTDQEHLDILVYNRPSVPDRTAFLLGQSTDDPTPAILEMAQALTGWGAGVLATPCVTAHNFLNVLQPAVSVPILNMVDGVSAYLKARGVQSAGLLATSGTVHAGIFQRSLAAHGIACALPDADGQAQVMRFIYQDIKAGRPVDQEAFGRVARALDAEVCILGCTELSLIKQAGLPQGRFLDALEVLAQEAILACGGKVHPAYRTLITQ